MSKLMPRCFLALLPAVASCGASAAVRDAAELMPGATLVYVGWSPVDEQSRGAVELAGSLVSTLASRQLDPLGPRVAAIRRGFELLSRALAHAGGAALIDVRTHERRVSLDAALVVRAGPDAARLADDLGQLLGALAAGESPQKRTVSGAKFDALRLPDSEMALLWGAHRDVFVVALSEPAAAAVVRCVDEEGDTLAQNEEMRYQRAKVKADLDSMELCLYVDVRRLVERIKTVVVEASGKPLPPIVDLLLQQLGVASIRSMYMHCDEVSGTPRTAIFAHVTGPYHGLLALCRQKPLTDDDLRIVRNDAYYALIGNLDLDALWREARRILGELAPEALPEIEGGLAMAGAFLGFSIAGDLLPALGDTWVLTDAPAHGGLLLSGAVLIVEARNSDALRGIVDRSFEVLASAAAMQNVRITRRGREDGGRRIQYVVFGGVPSPVAPAWCFVGDRCVIGLYPQTVAAAARQVDPASRGASLLDHPDYVAARRLLPKDALGLGFYDTAYLTRLIYPIGLPFSTLALSMADRPDAGGAEDAGAMIGELHLLEDALAGAVAAVGTTSVDDDGVLIVQVGSGEPLAGVAAGAALTTSVMLPSLARARILAKRDMCASNLRGIGMGVRVYAADHGDKLPDDLGELVRLGLVAPSHLVCPSSNLTDSDVLAALDGRGGRLSFTYIPGQTLSSDVRNVLIYEDLANHDGEDVGVLFLDGHVDRLKPERLRQEVRETFRRLKRESELPAEFR